ncbi:Protein of unknown function [Halogranum rubrum]|uniref:DUF2029 domain-containing protein n=1 Tax=Halogranum rubrum TaxID=553466 RepID=A0A1I4BLS8_9EURY|nr:glycosyltransferase family 87 protein [Halogranum rubrum]SFK69330.1 Protein of unknown function [Halogranum rubrum]
MQKLAIPNFEGMSKKFSFALFIAALTILPFWGIELLGQRAGLVWRGANIDFEAFYVAAHRFLQGVSIYDVDGISMSFIRQNQVSPWLYPPSHIMFVLPFALLPFEIAGNVWNAAWILALWFGINLILSEFGYKTSVGVKSLLLLGIISFSPAIHALKLGQITGFFAAGVALLFVLQEQAEQNGGVHSESPSRPAIFAFTTVAIVLTKPFYAPLAAGLLLSKRRLAGSGLTFVVFVIASIVIAAPGDFQLYYEVLRGGKGWVDLADPVEAWNEGYYEPFYIFGTASIYIKIALTVLLAGFLILARDVENHHGHYVIAAGVAAVPLVGPELYSTAFIPLIPAVVTLTLVENERSDGVPWLPVLSLVGMHLSTFALRLTWGVLDIFATPTMKPLLTLMQTGLWANVALLALAVFRIAQEMNMTERTTKGIVSNDKTNL